MTNSDNPSKGLKILIIEDEESLVDVLQSKLKKEGYEIEYAYDGEEGLTKIETWHPDLILLDIVMPKMNGYEVLEELNKKGSKIPVIIISNSGQVVEIEKTKKLGAVDHLIKTEFSPADVLRKVKNYLNNEDGKEPAGKKVPDLEPRNNPDGRSNGIKVLLVEDDAFLREICSKKLVKEGFTVFEAVDGEQATQGVGEVRADIILLDIILPAVDGFQILNYIRHHDDKEVAKTPVIMLSNLGQEGDISKAMDMGANDYLVKAHFTTEEIIEKIKKVLSEQKNKV